MATTTIRDRSDMAEEKADHRAALQAARDPSRFCPTCSTQLVDHRCKLKCPMCGFYLSCSDFY